MTSEHTTPKQQAHWIAARVEAGATAGRAVEAEGASEGVGEVEGASALVRTLC